MSPFLLSQILAAGAFACGFASFQFSDKRNICLCFVASGLLNSGHFFLLGRPESGALMVVVAVRYGVALFTNDRRAMYLFIVVSVCVFLATYQSRLAFVALVAALFGSIASFQSTDRLMRLTMFCGTLCWVIHNTLARSPVAAVMEVAFLTSNVVGYSRYYLRAPRRSEQVTTSTEGFEG